MSLTRLCFIPTHTKKKKNGNELDKDNIAQKAQLSCQKLYIEENNPGLPGLNVQTTTVIL